MNEPFYVSYLIILSIVLTSMYAWKNERILEHWLEKPYQIANQGKWYQLFTSHFIHADWVHLIFNSITLYFFGPVVESIIGLGNFLLVYLFSQIGSGLLTLIIHRNNPHYSSLGASGAILGILYLYIVFYPMSPIYLFFIPIGIPSLLFGILFLFFSLWGMEGQRFRLSHEGHLGGMMIGILFGLYFRFF
ncbi:MAG: hypothetical protein Kow00108_07560 [Calditrichia bacterium]